MAKLKIKNSRIYNLHFFKRNSFSVERCKNINSARKGNLRGNLIITNCEQYSIAIAVSQGCHHFILQLRKIASLEVGYKELQFSSKIITNYEQFIADFSSIQSTNNLSLVVPKGSLGGKQGTESRKLQFFNITI